MHTKGPHPCLVYVTPPMMHRGQPAVNIINFQTVDLNDSAAATVERLRLFGNEPSSLTLSLVAAVTKAAATAAAAGANDPWSCRCINRPI
jgi:hypothetical protein